MEFVAQVIKNAFFLLLFVRIAVIVLIVYVGYKVCCNPSFSTFVRRVVGLPPKNVQ
jgi:hypothetical protein